MSDLKSESKVYKQLLSSNYSKQAQLLFKKNNLMTVISMQLFFITDNLFQKRFSDFNPKFFSDYGTNY